MGRGGVRGGRGTSRDLAAAAAPPGAGRVCPTLTRPEQGRDTGVAPVPAGRLGSAAVPPPSRHAQGCGRFSVKVTPPPLCFSPWGRPAPTRYAEIRVGPSCELGQRAPGAPSLPPAAELPRTPFLLAVRGGNICPVVRGGNACRRL